MEITDEREMQKKNNKGRKKQGGQMLKWKSES